MEADDGARLWVATSGNGPPVVLAHGGPGIADNLEPVAEMLQDLAMVHRFDQRGAGRSEHAGPYSIAQSVADLEAIRTHFGHERWVVLGHSWGANLAVLYGQRHPERVTAIIYLCGIGLEWWPTHREQHKRAQRERLGPEMAERLRVLAARERDHDEQREYARLYLQTEFIDRRRAPKLAAMVQVNDNRYAGNSAAHHAINAELKTLALAPQQAECRKIRAPVLVVDCHGDPRPDVANDSLVACLPNVRRASLENCGHFPWLENPQALRGLLRSFMADVRRPSR